MTATRSTTLAASRPGYDGVARVGREERTYRADEDPRGAGFLRDVLAHHRGDPMAYERLGRHQREESVERAAYARPGGPWGGAARAAGDVTTANWAGLVVPQYLTDMYAPAAANLRPTADIATPHPLPPEGLTLNISRVTTPSAVGLQATELTAVSTQTMDDTILTENVQTAAGSLNVSRQAIERGTLTEEVMWQDLMNRYATDLDKQLVTQATTGLSANSATVTYTSASPTAAELWPFLFQAASKGEQAFLNMAPMSHVIMHTRRWNFLMAQVGTSWPFMGSAAMPPQQGALIVPGQYGTGAVRGILNNGLKVVVDNNVNITVGGTQDEIHVVAASELHLWEDPAAPMMIRAEQPNATTLGVLLVLYGFYGYTVRRFGATAHQKIVGSGTAAPAGF